MRMLHAANLSSKPVNQLMIFYSTSRLQTFGNKAAKPKASLIVEHLVKKTKVT